MDIKQNVTALVRSYLFWMRLTGLVFCVIPFGALYVHYATATALDDYHDPISLNLLVAVLAPFLLGAVVLHMAEREELNRLISKIVDDKIHATLTQGRLPKTASKTLVVPREKEVIQQPE